MFTKFKYRTLGDYIFLHIFAADITISCQSDVSNH